LRVIAVDPGKTTGLACSDNGHVVALAASPHPIEAWKWIYSHYMAAEGVASVIIEDYQGSGPASEPAIYTIKAVGFLSYTCALMSMTYRVVPPQRRKSQVDRAKTIVEAWNTEHGTHWPIHTVDALAHAFAEEVSSVRTNRRSG
jgi:hypothetical protein